MTILAALALLAAAVPPGPLDFAAQTLRTEPKERRAYLHGSVQISRGDFVVLCDDAVADFAEDKPAKAKPGKGSKKLQKASTMAPGLLGSEVQKFTLDGHVRMQRGKRTAEAQHGELDNDAQTLLLTGNGKEDPVLRDGPETLTGERILLHLDSEDVNVVHPRLVLRRTVPETEDKTPSPTRVEASKLFLDRSAQLARFTDEVVVRRGDMTVRGPLMDARYDKSGEVTRLLLSGGVEMRQGDRRAVAQKADYDPRAKELILTGQPRLFDRGDTLAGDRITVNLDSHEVRVDRAHGLLRPRNPSATGAR